MPAFAEGNCWCLSLLGSNCLQVCQSNTPICPHSSVFFGLVYLSNFLREMEVWITLLCDPRQKPGGSITLSFLKESFENKLFCQQVKMTLLPSTPQNQHIAKNIFHL